MNEGLRIIKGVIENFKNISHREITINGRSMVIMGKNEAGKSSLVQALLSPVNSKLVPQKPIKDGEDKGRTTVELSGMLNGEAKKYVIDVYYTEGKKGRIILTDQDGGEIKNAKSVIDTLIGNIGFDIFDFLAKGTTKEGNPSEAGIKQQIEVLKGFLDHNDVVVLDEANKEIKEAKDQKNYTNKRIKELEAQVKESEYSGEDLVKYSKEKDPKAIQEKISSLSEDIQKYSEVESGVKSREDKQEEIKENLLSYSRDELFNLQDKLTPLSEKYNEFNFNEIQLEIKKQLNYHEQFHILENEINQGIQWLKDRQKPDLSLLNEQLEKIHEHNRNCEKIKGFQEKHTEISKLKKDYKKSQDNVKKCELNKKGIFSKASLPVKGLTFDEEGIWYQKPGSDEKLPFREGQLPKSLFIAIGVKIAMAMNPNLRVLRIQDGESLDNDTLKTVLKMAEKEGYQLLVEKVSDDYDEIEIEFIEKEL